MALTPIDHSIYAESVAADLETQLWSDPESFDVLLFRAVLDSGETTAANALEVGTLQDSSRAIGYTSPEQVRGKRIPEDFTALRSTLAGDGINAMEADEEPTILLLLAKDIPLQSVIQFEEVVEFGTTRTVTLYLLHSAPMGGRAPAVGMKHYFIPFEDQESVFKG